MVVDDFSRECLALVVDNSLSGRRVARELIGSPTCAADHYDRQRQRDGAGVARDARVAGRARRGLALHRARQPSRTALSRA